MGSLPRVSLVTGPAAVVPAAALVDPLAAFTGTTTALLYAEERGSTRVSYAELQARSNAMGRAVAAHAHARGPNRDGDHVVAVCMSPTHRTVMSLLAVWKAGAAYVPIDPGFPQPRIAHILKDAEPSLIIYDDTAEPAMFSGCGVPAVSFEELSAEAGGLPGDKPSEAEVLVQPTADTIAIVLYTSGSTGIPKGVRLPYSAICNRLWWQFRKFPFSSGERSCVWKTALTFVDSVCEIWGPLLHGRTLVILSREVTKDPQRLVRVLAEHEIQRLVLVPTLLRSLLMYLSLNRTERPLRQLKLWICSGETLSKELAAQFFQHFGDNEGYRLANFYGSTEVMGDVTYYVIEKSQQLDAHPSIPIGEPVDNCAVYLLDEEMSPAREADPGEVWVSGRNLASGYVGGQAPDKFCYNPHATHPDFGKLYRTGDFGMLNKGMILYAGRTDSQVKIRGHRVDLMEVERAVSAVSGVEKAVVLCYGLERGSPEILAFVTVEPDARLAAQHIETALKSSLTHYMLPQVIVIDSVPLLVNGKVDRQALLKMYENTNNNDDAEVSLDMDYTGVEPERLDVAKVLFETIGEVLGRAVRGTLSVRVGFFELGGNSLNSIYTITRLRDKGYFIEISDFLSAESLGEVLEHLQESAGGARADADEPGRFTAATMREDHERDVIDMIVSSFYEKAELEQFLKHEIETEDYAHCVRACWAALLRAGLSVVLEDTAGTPVAVALNFDARDEPEIELSGGLAKIMTFLEYVESSVRDTMLPEGKGAVLHSFMMATSRALHPRDNVSAVRALEHATLRLARAHRFRGVFTTNTSPLTQQLATDVLGFRTLLDYQINEYVDPNGDRIFGDAPDDMRVVVCWKPVD